MEVPLPIGYQDEIVAWTEDADRTIGSDHFVAENAHMWDVMIILELYPEG